jgi:hypothetical protein
MGERDYQGLHWLLYIYLQQGRYGEAEELLHVMQQSLAEFPKDDPRNLMFGTAPFCFQPYEIKQEWFVAGGH